jgi:hypothetical protein
MWFVYGMHAVTLLDTGGLCRAPQAGQPVLCTRGSMTTVSSARFRSCRIKKTVRDTAVNSAAYIEANSDS